MPELISVRHYHYLTRDTPALYWRIMIIPSLSSLKLWSLETARVILRRNYYAATCATVFLRNRAQILARSEFPKLHFKQRVMSVICFFTAVGIGRENEKYLKLTVRKIVTAVMTLPLPVLLVALPYHVLQGCRTRIDYTSLLGSCQLFVRLTEMRWETVLGI